MAQTYKFGNGTWARKKGSTLAYSDTNNAFKPLPFSFERNSIATRVNKEGLIEVVGNDIPRIDYTDSTEGALLLENSSTNLITYSEDFSNASWIKNNVNLTSGFISPNGTANAYKITEDLTNATHRIRIASLANGSAANKQFTYSIFVKKSEVKWFLLKTVINGQSLTVDVWFDLENGVIGTESNGSGTIEDYGNDWYRCSINIVTNSSANSLNIYGYLADKDGIPENYQGDGTSGVYIWGAMLEQNSVASSYIPTNGSTVQRAAETCNESGNSEVFNDSQGVLFANISSFVIDGSYRQISISNGSVSNYILIGLRNDTGNIYFDGSSCDTVITNTKNVNSFAKCAFKYELNNFSFWLNGFKVGVDTSASVPIGLNKLDFGIVGVNNFYGNTKEIGILR